MSAWQVRLKSLQQLTGAEKNLIEGKLLTFGDGTKAERWFKEDDTDEDAVQRLSALLPDAGESEKAQMVFRSPAKQECHKVDGVLLRGVGNL